MIWYLSVAHAPQSPGSKPKDDPTLVDEHQLSRHLTLLLRDACAAKDLSYSFSDVGTSYPEKSYGEVKQAKVERLDEIGKMDPDAVGIELHFQPGSGCAALYWHSNARGKQIGEAILSHLEKVPSVGKRHWTRHNGEPRENPGHIPCPNPDYWSESPDYSPFFVGQPKPTSLIIEVGSIEDWIEISRDAEQIADAIAEALKEIQDAL